MTMDNWTGPSGATQRRSPPVAPAHRWGAAIARWRARSTVRPWELLGLAAVLVTAAFLNVFRLGQEGYANTYYAAAVKSMLQSWHNFFFVSFDPGGFVSVDKPPLGFWVQTASAKLFGFHGWSLLLPEVVAGVLSVVVLFSLVRRAWGPVAGLLAALGLALTPVAVAVNRNNTIDSLLVLTLLLAAGAVLRGTETGRRRWLLAGMALVGLGFNIKMMQAYLVLPALVLVYLLAAPHGWRARLGHLAVGGVVLVAVSFAWIAAVDLTPAANRPYVGSSQHNSALELALGYNGLQRLLGMNRSGPASASPVTDAAGQAGSSAGIDGGVPAGPDISATLSPAGDTGAAQPTAAPGGGLPPGGGPGGIFNNGATGPLRLINAQLGGQASWLLAPALLGAVVAMWQVGPLRRRDRRWQSVLLWGMWLLPAATFFSVAGFFHSYYLVMLAPPIAALAGIGLVALWRAGGRGRWMASLLPAVLVASGVLQAYLLRSYPDWNRWLTPLVIGLSVAAAGAVALTRLPRVARTGVTVHRAAMALTVTAVFLAPAVWSIATVRGQGGALPAGGPATARGFGGPPPLAGGTGPGTVDASLQVDTPTAEPAADGGPTVAVGNTGPTGTPPTSPPGLPPNGPRQGVDSGLISYLEANRDGYRFLVATSSSMTAGPIILQTGEPVMAMGGFSGGDPILTADDLTRMVSDGTVRFFLLQGGGGPGNDTLTTWITAHATLVPASAWGGATTATAGGFGGTPRLYQITAGAGA